MDARGTLYPQLHGVCPYVVATPEGRPRDLHAGRLVDVLDRGFRRAEALRRGAHGAIELFARMERPALRTGPGADAALPVARSEILVALGCGSLDDQALDADLP